MTKPEQTSELLQSTPFSIVITGEWPGAGQSTTASLLAKQLGFRRVYAGFLFRKFAHVWNQVKDKMSWETFEQGVEDGSIDIGDYEFNETDFQEKTLHAFQFQLKKAQLPELWDKIIDKQSLVALDSPRVVVEAKVGVLLDKTGLMPAKRRRHRVFKVLLTCPPEISSHRMIKRKMDNHELERLEKDSPKYLDLVRETATETIERHMRDWERYEKIYGIYRSSIYRPGIIRVFTADKRQEEVVAVILSVISDKLTRSKQGKKKESFGKLRTGLK
jgi:cytidylate kinase